MWYLILSFILAVWVAFDGRKRITYYIPWSVWTVILGPIVLPIYLAKRPLLEGEVREGGTAWNILKNFAILWTLFMFVAAVWGMLTVGQQTTGLQSDAEKAGAAIGTALGLGMIIGLWFVLFVGSFILGLILKKSSIVERGIPHEISSEISRIQVKGRNNIGPIGWIGIVLLLMILIGTFANPSNKDLSIKSNKNNSLTTSSNSFDFATRPPFVADSIWGLSPEIIKQREYFEMSDQKDDKLSFSGTTRINQSDSLYTMVIYYFQSERLNKVTYFLQYSSNIDTAYVAITKKLHALFKGHYGSPINSSIYWINNLYENQSSMLGKALMLGHVSYSSSWDLKRTKINYSVWGHLDGKLTFSVDYLSKEYSNFLTKE